MAALPVVVKEAAKARKPVDNILGNAKARELKAAGVKQVASKLRELAADKKVPKRKVVAPVVKRKVAVAVGRAREDKARAKRLRVAQPEHKADKPRELAEPEVVLGKERENKRLVRVRARPAHRPEALEERIPSGERAVAAGKGKGKSRRRLRDRMSGRAKAVAPVLEVLQVPIKGVNDNSRHLNHNRKAKAVARVLRVAARAEAGSNSSNSSNSNNSSKFTNHKAVEVEAVDEVVAAVADAGPNQLRLLIDRD